jgi:hypothetical protein
MLALCASECPQGTRPPTKFDENRAVRIGRDLDIAYF